MSDCSGLLCAMMPEISSRALWGLPLDSQNSRITFARICLLLSLWVWKQALVPFRVRNDSFKNNYRRKFTTWQVFNFYFLRPANLVCSVADLTFILQEVSYHPDNPLKVHYLFKADPLYDTSALFCYGSVRQEECEFWRQEYWVMCVKQSHMESSWQTEAAIC